MALEDIAVIIITKNEERNIARALRSAAAFAKVIVVDSQSSDRTQQIAKECGADIVTFEWNGEYPKKFGWCLETLPLKQDWVLFLDADEELTPELVGEIDALDLKAAGYFIKGAYVLDGQILRHGLQNNKLCLINRAKMTFPHIDDLDIPGGNEVEGHYQPVLRKNVPNDERLGQLHHVLYHHALENMAGWDERHACYASWEAGMNARKAWPVDPDPWRQRMKVLFRSMPCRGMIAFLHSYVWKCGFRDGRNGFRMAVMRYAYYRAIAKANKKADMLA